MTAFNRKLFSAAAIFSLGLLVLLSYILRKTIPMTTIYLGADRISYTLFVFVLSMAGIVFIWLAKKKFSAKIFRIISYILALILIFGFQVAAFIGSASSFRGFEWALETFLIGLLPVVIVIGGFLVLTGKRLIGIIFLLLFAFIALFHLALLLKTLPSLGRAFSSARTVDLLINLAIFCYSIACAIFNYKFIKSR